ncbi:TonB-dependent receptor plug domain-containing protein [Steroidobacter cummioxidans]|uniref:TonB-dependent receptor plug domain-containing protein n=1 Tax=Steroidobacter cummioxidans TaxID=1803913 RepID=UPI000E315A9E|nr:TonB-dependent receptor [Steroidobacter cummioxidans]
MLSRAFYRVGSDSPAQCGLAFAVASVLASALVAGPALAQDASTPAAETAAAGSSQLDTVVVTGSRLVRDGYEAPTPLTVVGSEQVAQQATPNLIDYLTTLPAFSGNYTPQSSTQNVSAGTAGTSAVNLRNLGTNRTLVLIDGQRSVPSTVTGLVDINTIPAQLIERVEVVTGGASAAYGSDAVSGVVNFILDKKFTGFKSEVSGGITSYGDNASYRVAMSMGTPFADGRGHLLLSGQQQQQEGILDGDRPWNTKGWQIINNPNYTATNGQPRRLLLPQIAPQNMTPGGIITQGPLRGTAFGQGGAPYQFQYGDLISGSAMQGGAWRSTSLHEIGQSIEPKLSAQNLFARLSYQVSDNVEAYIQSNWYSNDNISHAYPNDQYFGGMMVSVNNPFMPASVAARVQALGLTGNLNMGSSLADVGGVVIDTGREVLRNVIGLNGGFTVGDVDWNWDAYYQRGESRASESAVNSLNLVRYREALDSVLDPNTGAIVCRSTLTTPNNGCVPYNPFGIGVNSAAAIDYVAGQISHRNQTFKQDVVAASISATPFSSWAGPISIATGLEHRRESASGWSTPQDLAAEFFAGNYRPTFGKFNVTEGFFETAVPLAADLPFVRALDLNAAVRLTDYSTSGFVTTWKAGLTYSVNDDVRFRFTRSRDIRAPNINDLFNAGALQNNQVNNPVDGLNYLTEDVTTGNPNLKPEKADSTGFGVVFQPSFAPGLSASVDYWEIDLKDAINTVGRQAVVDLCFQGNQQFCQLINDGQPLRLDNSGPRNTIRITPINLAQQLVKGLDIEAGYSLPLTTLGFDDGRVSFRLIATHFMKNYRNDTFTVPTDTAGENYGNTGSPDWRWTAVLGYDNVSFNSALTVRGVSAGVYSNTLIECTSNCPESTIARPTINENDLAGAIYLDWAMTYKMLLGASQDTQVELFFNVKNIANKDPVIAVGGPGGVPFDTVSTNANVYDSLGRVFRAGFRVKM